MLNDIRESILMCYVNFYTYLTRSKFSGVYSR